MENSLKREIRKVQVSSNAMTRHLSSGVIKKTNMKGKRDSLKREIRKTQVFSDAMTRHLSSGEKKRLMWKAKRLIWKAFVHLSLFIEKHPHYNSMESIYTRSICIVKELLVIYYKGWNHACLDKIDIEVILSKINKEEKDDGQIESFRWGIDIIETKHKKNKTNT